MEIMVLIEELVELLAVNEGTAVVPLPANPIEVFELFHANVAPDGEDVKEFSGTILPEQKVKSGSKTITGLGLTVIE
jgi:hypothetical protein